MTEAEIESKCEDILTEGFCVLKDLLPRQVIADCARAFEPILEAHIDEISTDPNRGPNRHYIRLPFEPPFADPIIYENEAVLSVVDRLLGEEVAMGSLATDTPLEGSVYQELHADVWALFPDDVQLPPPYILTMNFPFVDVTKDNGPFQAVRGTHLIPREEGLRKVKSGEIPLEPVFLNAGDVLLRDPRHIHGGTPNRTSTPRPVAVISYLRSWYRFDKLLAISKAERTKLSERGEQLLRFAPREV